MRRKTMMALAISATMLSACNRGATNESVNAAANESSGNEAAATSNTTAEAAKPEAAAPAETAMAAGGTGLDRAYLVGRWTDDGDCAAGSTTEFRADGSFLFPWGDTGQWTLAGDQLTLTGNTHAFTIRVIDQNTLERTASGGTPHRVTRCT